MANTGAQYLPTGGEGPVQQWWGIYQAYIAINNDPLAQGRVKLRVPQVFGQMTSGWASPVVPLSYVPKVGTTVTVMFVGGDPTLPVWMGNFAIPEGAAGFVVAATAPASPEIGEIWVNSSTGLMSEWNGAGWVGYQIGGAAIQTGAALDAPNITGGTITGSQFVADGTAGEFLGYTGTPASGNLFVSVSPVAGTDGETNPYLQGVVVYDDTGYIQMDINTTVGAAAINMATGIGSEYDHPAMYAWSPNAGTTAEYEELAILGPASTYDEKQPSIVLTGSAKDGSSLAGTTVNTYDGFTINRSLDGNSYPWTRAWKEASATTINSTTPIPVSGLSFNVAARTYKVSGRIYGQAAASGVPQPGSIRFGGTATASGLSIDVQMIEYGEGETANIGWIDALDQDPSAIAGAWPNNAEYSIRFEGIAAFSAPGTFDVLGRVTSSSSDASWSTTDFSYMIIEPL